jgi:predicted Fe-Mo cluster-binding NifX family protein
VPKLLGLEGARLQADDEGIVPIAFGKTLKVVSIGLMLDNPNEAVIWRGPMKHNLIQQFIEGVNWGEIDYLIVDCPPGTGDEAISTAQVLGTIDGVVIVTTPQDIAVLDVRKCVTFCKQLSLPVVGVIENMSGFICPHCQKRTDIFAGPGAERIAADFGVAHLGNIPLDPALAQACDAGKPFVDFDADSPTAQALVHAFAPLITEPHQPIETKETNQMKIAIPLAGGKLSAHFGHCEQFAIVSVDPESKIITEQVLMTPPAHEPGVLPAWLAEQGATAIIAGGMGQRAQMLFAENNIEVIIGAPAETPEELVSNYLAGSLESGENICDH